MVQLRKTLAIDASPDEVWEVLGDLAATTEWLPGTVAARMEGATRICTTADGSQIREEISDYAPERRRYRYRHLEIPVPVRSSSGSFRVDPRNGGAEVVLECRFAARDGADEDEVGRMFGHALGQSLESLKQRVERGRRWDAQ